jgi:hypothetical protein
MTEIEMPRRRHPQGGPPLGLLAVISTGLLLLGIVASAALGGVVPSPYGAAGVIREYFTSQSDAVHVDGVLVFASSVPLAIYAATASARLRQLGVTAPGATIALAGGLLAAAALAASGLLLWTVSRPAVRDEEPLVRALHDLAFLAGGPAHVVFLGLLVAGIAVPALMLRLVPGPLAWAGLVLAALAEVTTLALVWPGLGLLVPLVRFPALAWLIAVGFALPHRLRSRPNARMGQSGELPRPSTRESRTGA